MSERVKATVSALIQRNGEYLMVKNAKDGLWSPPAGKIEHNEMPQIAIERECREEIGTEINILGITGFYYFTSSHGNWISNTSFLARLNGKPKIVNPEAISEIEWMNLEKIAELNSHKKVRGSNLYLIRDYQENRTTYALEILKRLN